MIAPNLDDLDINIKASLNIKNHTALDNRKAGELCLPLPNVISAN